MGWRIPDCRRAESHTRDAEGVGQAGEFGCVIDLLELAADVNGSALFASPSVCARVGQLTTGMLKAS